MKVTASATPTHNPWGEAYWASGLRENLTSRSYGEGLETGRALTQVPRQSFTRQEEEEELRSYAIQKRLTERQVPPRGTNTQGGCQSSVIKILRNPLYKGEAAYNRSQQADTTRPRGPQGLKDIRPGNNRSRIARPRDEWITVRVPALVDPDLWEVAQAQLANNRERAARNNTKHDY